MQSASTFPKENEPQIWNAIKFGALVENVVMDPETRVFDFNDGSLTENTRVGYPVEFIPNAAIPGVGGQPKTVVFLTADAFGVLPPIAKLDKDMAMYPLCIGLHLKAGRHRARHYRAAGYLLHLLRRSLPSPGSERLR